MSVEKQEKEKIYYNHTSKYDIVKDGYAPKATIALKLSPDGKEFQYGVGVCSDDDNFSRKYGRELALGRMNEGFGIIPVPESLGDLDDHQKCLTMIYTLTESVIARSRKWKKRIRKYNSQNTVKS